MISTKPQQHGVRIVEVTEDQDGQRLDNFLFKCLNNVPRTRVYRLIRKGEVRVNRKRAKPDTRLQDGDQVRLPPVHIDSSSSPSDPPPRLLKLISNSILFENEHLLVVNKPDSIAVHGGSGLRFGVIDLVRQIRGDDGIELVHRLDRDTSGCLMLAKSRKSLLHLQQALKSRQISKIYLAIVHGYWPSSLQSIDQPLLKTLGGNAERRVRIDDSGKPALTRVLKNAHQGEFSILALELVTGRTHQIRVHCQYAGHPIAGDSKYGDTSLDRAGRKLGINRLMLHAWRLAVPASEFNPALNLLAPVPDIFMRLGGDQLQTDFILADGQSQAINHE